jgi:hypothetical protein
MSVPEVALRFRHAVRLTVSSLAEHPLMASRCPLRNPRLQNLRSWPVAGFDAIRTSRTPARSASSEYCTRSGMSGVSSNGTAATCVNRPIVRPPAGDNRGNRVP